MYFLLLFLLPIIIYVTIFLNAVENKRIIDFGLSTRRFLILEQN